MSSIKLSKTATKSIAEAYNDQYFPDNVPISMYTKFDWLTEHKMNFYHIFIAAGITYICLKAYQDNEAPLFIESG